MLNAYIKRAINYTLDTGRVGFEPTMYFYISGYHTRLA